MRQISWTAALLISSVLAVPFTATRAGADELYRLNQNQNGFDLPGVQLPQGQDEVRAADGTTCRSAVSGSGAYVDLGVIRSGRSNTFDTNDLATYGRVVIPIGRTPERLDCARLYKLEVQRLQMELDMMKMGLGPTGPITSSVTPETARKAKGWAEIGWTDTN